MHSLSDWAAFPNPRLEARYRKWVLDTFRLQFDLVWSAMDLLSSMVILYRLIKWWPQRKFTLHCMLLTICDIMATSIIPLLAVKARPLYSNIRTPLLAIMRITKTYWTAELNRLTFHPNKHHMRIMKLISTGPGSYCMLATFGWQLPIEAQLVVGTASTALSLTYVLAICDFAFRSKHSTIFIRQCYHWIDYGNAMALSAVTGFNVGSHAESSDPCAVVQRWVMVCWGLLLPTMLLAVLELWYFRPHFLLRAGGDSGHNAETESMLSTLKTKLVLVLVLLGWFLSLSWQVLLLIDGSARLKMQDAETTGWWW